MKPLHFQGKPCDLVAKTHTGTPIIWIEGECACFEVPLCFLQAQNPRRHVITMLCRAPRLGTQEYRDMVHDRKKG